MKQQQTPARYPVTPMKRSSTRTLTSHTGSLPRPDDLADLMLRKEAGHPVNERALAERVRSAIREAVERQAAIGIDVVSDGEFSKIGFNNYVKDRFTGFGGEQTPWKSREFEDFPDIWQYLREWNYRRGVSQRPAPSCIGPVAMRDPEIARADVANLKAALQSVNVEEAFIPAASPGSVALIIGNRYYPSYEKYLLALADALREEYRIVVEGGLLLQLDCPDLGMCGHIQFAGASREEFRRTMELHIEALNHALAGLPEERLRMHLCWGNYLGPHHLDRPLADIIDIALKARVNAVSYEASNPRHEHEWRVWESVKLPEGKLLLPGVIDSLNNHVEHPQVVADRITRVARIVGRENVIASSDCGFGTFVGFGAVFPSVAWAKLRVLVEGAKLATAELWR